MSSSKKAGTIIVFAVKYLWTPKSGNSKFSQLYVVGTLNLYLKTPGTKRKESDQSDHHVLRKHPKRAVLLEYFDVRQKQQNWTTFWPFSLIVPIPFAL
jgi:hypothetical protein